MKQLNDAHKESLENLLKEVPSAEVLETLALYCNAANTNLIPNDKRDNMVKILHFAKNIVQACEC